MSRSVLSSTILLILCAALLAGCGPAPTATPVPALPTTIVEATAIPPTVAPESSATAIPAATLVPTAAIAPVALPTPAVVSGARIAGRVLWGSQPVAGATVLMGARGWQMQPADALAQAVADAEGRYTIVNPPPGDYLMVALWPDGAPSQAQVTPVSVGVLQSLEDVTVYLAKSLAWVEPAPETAWPAAPTLRWEPLAEASQYRVWILDAGTTALWVDKVVTETFMTVEEPLPAGRPYQAEVSAYDANKGLLACAIVTFGVEGGEPGAGGEQPGAPCVQAFERRELKQPYQTTTGQPRYTLSTQELNQLLAEMGVASVCIPPEVGAPFINADWSAAYGTAQSGRMLSLGFEGLYHGAGWSDGSIVYSTYDFAAGTEYETWATAEDREVLALSSVTPIEINGALGFVRIKPAELALGARPVYLTYVFPRANDYVAVVYTLGEYDANQDIAPLIAQFQGADYPADRAAMAATFDQMKATLRWTK